MLTDKLLAAGWAKSIDPLLRHEVETVHRLGSLGYQTGPSEPRVDEHGRATCTKWLRIIMYKMRAIQDEPSQTIEDGEERG